VSMASSAGAEDRVATPSERSESRDRHSASSRLHKITYLIFSAMKRNGFVIRQERLAKISLIIDVFV
jgi:hypothetical protein